MFHQLQSLKIADESNGSVVDAQRTLTGSEQVSPAKNLRILGKPASHGLQEIDSEVSTQTDEDESDAASQSSRASRYDEMGSFIAFDAEFDDAESAASRRHGRSSGLVKKKIGKTVRASSSEKRSSSERLPRQQKRPSNMIKELLPHNEDVNKKTRYDNQEPLLENINDYKPTRSQQRFLDNKPVSPKTYDEKKLMDEQFKKIRGRKVYYSSHMQTTPKHSSLARKAKISPHQIKQMTKVESRKTSSLKASDRIVEIQAEMNLDDWRKWDERKCKSKPKYSSCSACYSR